MKEIRKPYFILVIVGFMTFIFSILVDFFMRKPIDYVFAIIIGMIFGGIFFVLSHLFNATMQRLKK